MANYYDTLLVCKSNSKLLQKIDPRSLTKDSNSEFITCKNGKYHFTTINGTIHESIVALSKKFPTETFKAKVWNVDVYDSEIQTFKFKAGIARRTKVEPRYGYFIPPIEEIMGKKLFKRFMNIALKQIKRIDRLSDIPTTIRKGTERKHDIHSSYTIIVEDRDYKIEATKIGLSYIAVEGYIKVLEDSIPRWQAVDCDMRIDIKVAHQMGNGANEAEEDMYEPLPF